MAAGTDPQQEEDLDDKKMPLLEHLVELRTRLLWTVLVFIVAFFVCFAVHREIYNFLIEPLAQIMDRVGGSKRMIYTALTEAFFTYVKVAAFAAIIVTFPVFATQLWMFVAPGLYKNEKKAFLPFLVISPILFVIGGAMVYYLVMPMAWEFLLGFQTTRAETVLPIELEAKVGEYLGLVMKLILAFGFSFQMPVALTLMARVGLVRSTSLAKARKYAVVGVFVMAAVITPPDVISQLLLALPMLVLYEISIIAARSVEKSRGDDDDDDLDDDDDDPPPGGSGGSGGGSGGSGGTSAPAGEAAAPAIAAATAAVAADSATGADTDSSETDSEEEDGDDDGNDGDDDAVEETDWNHRS